MPEVQLSQYETELVLSILHGEDRYVQNETHDH